MKSMKKLSWVRACPAATICTATGVAGETGHPARSGLSVRMKERARSRLTGSRTRGSPLADQAATPTCGPSMCLFQGVAMINLLIVGGFFLPAIAAFGTIAIVSRLAFAVLLW